MDHNKKWKILQEMGKPDHLPCFLTSFHGQCLPLPVMLGIAVALRLPVQERALGDVTLPRYQAKVKRQQLEPDMEQRTGSNLGKAYVKAVYCYPS